MSTWSTPTDIMGNVLEKIAADPKASALMKGVGLAYDVHKAMPPDLASPIPYFPEDVST